MACLAFCYCLCSVMKVMTCTEESFAVRAPLYEHWKRSFQNDCYDAIAIECADGPFTSPVAAQADARGICDMKYGT